MADQDGPGPAGGAFVDEVGNDIRIGDMVVVTVRHAGRGAHGSLGLTPMRVVGFGRSRLRLTCPSRVGEDRVGPECCKVVEAGDGRPLRNWVTVQNEQAAVQVIGVERPPTR